MKQFLTFKTHYFVFIALFFFVGLCSFSTTAQKRCGTTVAIQSLLQKHPHIKERYERVKHSSFPDFSTQGIAKGTPIAEIPVVVHIVLQDPEKITDAQVASQIDVLNKDYQLLNADTSNRPDVWDNIAGDMKIHFCLAQRTPDNEPTNGIDRVTTSKASFNDISDAVSEVKHTQTGGANAWNSNEYLNIWICNLSGGYLGIGTPPETYPDEEQGVVVHYKAFGTTGNLLQEYNKGRSCTHEVGHYFNLLHLWGSNDVNKNCEDDDQVNDTPKQHKAVYGTPSFPTYDECSASFPGIMIDNFMGYVDDADMNMFTRGQVDRVKYALLHYRSGLLSSKGCQPVQLEEVDAKPKSIAAPRGKLCSSSTSPIITLQNFGTKKLNKVDIKYRIDQNAFKSFQWTGQLSSLDSTTLTLPHLTFSEGNHKLEVITSTPNGVTDENIHNDTLLSYFHLDPVITAPYTEDFETSTFPPEGWTINNPDQQYTWEKTNEGASSGTHSVVMKNLDYAENGPIDDIISPVIDIQNKDSAFLLFDVAAAVQSNPEGNNQYWDTLKVLISYDCGHSGTTVYKKWGKNLITTPNRLLYEFVPKKGEWRMDSIDLTTFLGRGPFRIIFRNVTNFENNIYLDHIQIKAKNINPILKEKEVLIVPNPFDHQLKIEFLKKPDHLQRVSIYNISGQLVSQKSSAAINRQNRIIFHLSHLSAGIYIVKLKYSDRKIIKKVMKLK